jgi:hypothetical protein
MQYEIVTCGSTDDATWQFYIVEDESYVAIPRFLCPDEQLALRLADRIHGERQDYFERGTSFGRGQMSRDIKRLLQEGD